MKQTLRRLVAAIFISLIIFTPLILTSAWGMNLAGDAYLLLQYARALAGSSGATFAAAAESAVASSPSTLFTLMVGALALLGIEPAAAAAIISALGWSAGHAICARDLQRLGLWRRRAESPAIRGDRGPYQ